MLRNETLRGLLINFCEESLCGESVDFLVDVTINYESLSDPDEQFGALSDIVENYLAEGSANEVNVSNAHRNAAAVWLTKREEFLALEGETRAHVLDLQRDEIAKMLAENLLVKFKQAPLTIAAMRALKGLKAPDHDPEVAAGENTLFGEEGSNVQDEGMRIMLQASAAAEVARIQRISRVGGDKLIGSPGEGVGGLNSRPLIRNDLTRDRQSSFEDVSFDGSDSFTMYSVDT
ncbi:unnamed protein product [Ectocarpus sp. CCAP 1310/34]|nr:unnamed protein product [Ectocarpus sp. CCAP 1310/34]